MGETSAPRPAEPVTCGAEPCPRRDSTWLPFTLVCRSTRHLSAAHTSWLRGTGLLVTVGPVPSHPAAFQLVLLGQGLLVLTRQP